MKERHLILIFHITEDIDWVFSFSREPRAANGAPAFGYRQSFDDLETSTPNQTGEYGLRTSSSYTTSWSVMKTTVVQLRLYEPDAAFARLMGATQVGDLVTYWISTNRWILYEVTTAPVKVGSYWRIAVEAVEYEESDGAQDPSTADGVTVYFRFSRALPSEELVQVISPTPPAPWRLVSGNYVPSETTQTREFTFSQGNTTLLVGTITYTRSDANVSAAVTANTGYSLTGFTVSGGASGGQTIITITHDDSGVRTSGWAIVL